MMGKKEGRGIPTKHEQSIGGRTDYGLAYGLVDGYQTPVYEGGKIVEIKGSQSVNPLKIGQSVTLCTTMERISFSGDIQKSDRLTIVGFRRAAEGGSEIVQVSNGKDTDWVRPSHLNEGGWVKVDMRQRQVQRQRPEEG